MNKRTWGKRFVLVLNILLICLMLYPWEHAAWAAAEPKLTSSEKTLYLGYNTYTIKVNNLVKNAVVTYQSSNKKIAAVSNKGVITPVDDGKAKITVTIKQNKKTYKRYLNITVKEPYISITKKKQELTQEDSFQFKAKVYGSSEKIKWKVSDEDLAHIDATTGKFTAFSTGTVTVTANAGSLKRSCQVTITALPVNELVMAGPSEMIVGETFTYTISNDMHMADSWWVSDDTIAELGDGDGTVQDITALKAGAFTIYAETSDGYGEKKVQVKDLQVTGNPYIPVTGTSFFTVNSKQLQKEGTWIIEDMEIAEKVEQTDDGIWIKGIKEGHTRLVLHYMSYSDIHKFYSDIYVGEAPDFVISGKSLINVHSTEDYSINLPEDSSIYWNISDDTKVEMTWYGNSMRLTAWEEGTYTITATVGGKQVALVITAVNEDATNITDPPTDDSSDSDTGNQDEAIDTGNSSDTGNTSDSGNTKDDTVGTTKKVTKNGIIYELRGTYAYVAGAEKGLKEAVILTEVEGLPVTRISKAFGQCPTLKSVTWQGASIILEDDCFYNNSSITSVTLKGGNITLGIRALSNCTALTSISFTGEVKRVGTMAFAGCTSLTELTIPGTETSYDKTTHYAGYGPFYGCSSLKVLRLKSKIVFADPKMEEIFFYGVWDNNMDSHIEELHLNIDQITTMNFLKYIGDNVRKVVLVNTRSICDMAFYSYDKLEEITIPASLVEIGDFAFSHCSSLKTINAEVNRARTFFVGAVFSDTQFDSIQGCYFNGAEDLLGREEYNALQKALSVVKELKASAADEYDIIKGAHDWIVLNTVYDYDNFNNNTIPRSSHQGAGVFVYGTAVCEGYMNAFKTLMDLAGIECHNVTGLAENDLFIGQHGWNIVKLRGEYYQIDCTWDDPAYDNGAVHYNYFLIGDAQMSLDHTWQYDYTNYPSCPKNYTDR